MPALFLAVDLYTPQPMLFPLAVNFQDPLFWAVLIGWILSVTLHEFAHGLVAHLGGDYTIKERGGLTLNPLQYIDPFTSLILPAIFLLLGGVPLPGGVTYVRRDLLRSRAWQSAVSLAGPAMNLILFVAFALPLHPKIGWVQITFPMALTPAQAFCGAMAVLQGLAVLFNLVPVPPLDGFGAISPYLPPEVRWKLSTPPISTIAFLVYFMAIWNVPGVMAKFIDIIAHALRLLGFDELHTILIYSGFNEALFGQSLLD